MTIKAQSPANVSVNTWWAILKTTYDCLKKDNLSLIAAGVAFYTLLSLFPLLFALVSLAGLVITPGELSQYFDNFYRLLPPGSQDVLYEHAERIVSKSDSRLTLGLIISMGIALWGSSKGANALIIACNIAYQETQSAGLVSMLIRRMMFALVAIIVLALALVLVSWIALLSQDTWWLAALLWGGLIALLLTSIALIYRYAPQRKRAKWRWVAPGALLALLFWMAASVGFGFYVTHYADYNKTYGSLGGVVLLLVWFYLSALILLIGAAFNGAMELHLRGDTTRGKDKPRGSRGAFVADNLAK